MACKECEEKSKTATTSVQSWTVLPLVDINNVPDDIDLLCGSDKEMKSWRIPASYFLDKIKELEKEIQELKNGK